MKLLRIGTGAGSGGCDRIDSAPALADRGALDVLVFECLADRSIALARLHRSRDPRHGDDPLIEARMHAVLPACVRNGVTVISNMAAAHLEAMRVALQDHHHLRAGRRDLLERDRGRAPAR